MIFVRSLLPVIPKQAHAIPAGCCWCCQCRGLPRNPVLGRIHRTGFPPAGENDGGGAMAIPGGCCWCCQCRGCHSFSVILGPSFCCRQCRGSFAVEVSVALLFLSSSFSGPLSVAVSVGACFLLPSFSWPPRESSPNREHQPGFPPAGENDTGGAMGHSRGMLLLSSLSGLSFYCRQCRGLPENPVLGRIHRTGFPPAGENDGGEGPAGCFCGRHCRACHSVAVSVGALLLLKSVSRFSFFRRHSRALFLLLSVSGLVFFAVILVAPTGIQS